MTIRYLLNLRLFNNRFRILLTKTIKIYKTTIFLNVFNSKTKQQLFQIPIALKMLDKILDKILVQLIIKFYFKGTSKESFKLFQQNKLKKL